MGDAQACKLLKWLEQCDAIECATAYWWSHSQHMCGLAWNEDHTATQTHTSSEWLLLLMRLNASVLLIVNSNEIILSNASCIVTVL